MLKPTKKTDARIVKTLSSIERAFLTLLSYKSYEDITVGDILAIADINRTTFYKYYNNKNELAHTLINEIKSQVFEPILDKRFALSWEEFIQEVPLTDVHYHKISMLWKIRTPTLNLKNDLYTLVKNKYIQSNPNTPGHLQLQGHLYASFCVAMAEFRLQNNELSHQEEHENIARVFTHILS